MVPMVGERLRSILTGRFCQARMFTKLFAVLEGEDPSNRVYAEIGNLGLFYEQVEIERDRDVSSPVSNLDSRSQAAGPGITRREGSSDGGFHA